jgi:hypothetical protein
VGIDEEASFMCAKCKFDPKCLVCHKDKLVSGDVEAHDHVMGDDTSVDVSGDKTKGDTAGPGSPNEEDDEAEEEGMVKEEKEEDEDIYLRFRCFRCKQEAHYAHRKLVLLLDVLPLTISGKSVLDF